MNLFNSVNQGHDGKARVVHVCEDARGFYVLKPSTGFRTKHFDTIEDEGLKAAFERQIACTQNNAFYNEGERAAEQEDYSLTANEA